MRGNEAGSFPNKTAGNLDQLFSEPLAWKFRLAAPTFCPNHGEEVKRFFTPGLGVGAGWEARALSLGAG